VPFTYIGAHYSSCPVEIRELWTRVFDSESGRAKLVQIVRQHLGASSLGVVPIFTCNRFDVCVEGLLSDEALSALLTAMTCEAIEILRSGRALGASDSVLVTKGQSSNVPEVVLEQLVLNPVRLQHMFRCWRGADAMKQLFRVACSLDSMVLGEPHILGQLKEQHALARDLGLVSAVLQQAFSRAFSVAKRVRTETDLGRNAVSIGHAAVTLANRIFEDFSRHRFLVIGAGEMAKLSAQHMVSKGAKDIVIANRSSERAQDLVTAIGCGRVLDLDTAINEVCSFDVVIVATASREILLHREHFHEVTRLRRGEPAVIVDVAVPRNVSPDCSQASSDLFVFDIDDLEKVMHSNRELRRDAAAQAEEIIAAETQDFVRARQERDNLQAVAALHQLIQQTVSREILRTLQRDGEIRGVANIDAIARSVAKRLVTGPSQWVRTHGTEDAAAGEWILRLFPGTAAQSLEPGEASELGVSDS
jgi:glutamyl-tRNA reductase